MFDDEFNNDRLTALLDGVPPAGWRAGLPAGSGPEDKAGEPSKPQLGKKDAVAIALRNQALASTRGWQQLQYMDGAAGSVMIDKRRFQSHVDRRIADLNAKLNGTNASISLQAVGALQMSAESVVLKILTNAADTTLKMRHRTLVIGSDITEAAKKVLRGILVQEDVECTSTFECEGSRMATVPSSHPRAKPWMQEHARKAVFLSQALLKDHDDPESSSLVVMDKGELLCMNQILVDTRIPMGFGFGLYRVHDYSHPFLRSSNIYSVISQPAETLTHSYVLIHDINYRVESPQLSASHYAEDNRCARRSQFGSLRCRYPRRPPEPSSVLALDRGTPV